MVFIQDKSTPQDIILLKNTEDTGPYFTLKIFNQTYNWEEEVMNLSQFNNFLVFNLYFRKFKDGEYEYNLFNTSGELIGSGLISIGLDYKSQVIKEYHI